MRLRLARNEVVVLALGLVSAACGPGTESHADFERMRVQQRYSPYGSGRFFRDGMAMRTPPPGTVAREGVERSDSAPSQFSGNITAQVLAIASMPARVQVGEEDFHIYCAACHGEQASGNSVVGANLKPPPPLLLAAHARALSDSDVFTIISKGHHRMPAYGWAIPDAERLDVIAYLRALQQGQGNTR